MPGHALGLPGPHGGSSVEDALNSKVQETGGTVKLRTSLAAAGTAVVLGTTGALVLPAVASAHSTTHTLKFISVQKKSVMFSDAAGGQQDTDVNAAGQIVGFDMLHITVASATTGNVNITGDFNGGFLYGTGTVKFSTGAFSNGKVTGGTGSFAGATGTITVKTISSTKKAVTVTYST
jgi:hypothetical protein